MKTAAIIILVLGIVMTVITGISVITQKKTDESKPQVEVTVDPGDKTYWSPWMGVLLIAVGGSLLIYTRKKTVI